ncbi:autophagy-related protein 13-like [Dendronephthya gigantea]|uniref:autophagy-related protein 13-like n=1 Tax=Dendronephthya gigantea TaxID=151771 RepID=UPI00106D6F14|nr:autophagy-related protein 13-like [Dendronephthya gigantea]
MVDQTSRQLTPQEEKDLNKFQKFFCYKVVQVIVQSRLGERISSTSKPNAMGYDWFNLAINDFQEVLQETKKIMENNRLPSRDNPLCIEISLKTNEGSTMVLETWRLGMDEKRENSSKITYTVYNRMGILLKSLIAVTRVTPAYKIAKNQGHDYILCYRIYFGQVRVSEFGENYHVIPVGSIGTPRGGLALSVAHRTKLALPQGNSQASARLGSTVSPSGDVTAQLGNITDSGMQYPVAMTSEFRHHIVEEIASAVADTDLSNSSLSPRTFNTAPSIAIEPASPIETTPSNHTEHVSERSSSAPQEFKSRRNRTFSETANGNDDCGTHGAFVSQGGTKSSAGITPLSSTPPFASLLLNKPISSSIGRETSTASNQKTPEGHKNGSMKSMKNNSNTNSSAVEDDFIMVELKAAFAPETSSTDLTQFYRDCQNAPPLQLFDLPAHAQPLSTVMDTMSDELDVFEQNMKNFDEFVEQLESKKG